MTCGTALEGGNAAYVAEAVTADGQLAYQDCLPPGIAGFAPFEQELQALQDAGGDPYARLICHDEERRSMLLERLGRPLASLGWAADRQIAAITATLARGWRQARPGRLPTGAAKAEWLAGFITGAWRDLGEPCTERAARRPTDYAAERASRADPRHAVLVHGDAHPPTCWRFQTALITAPTWPSGSSTPKAWPPNRLMTSAWSCAAGTRTCWPSTRLPLPSSAARR